MAKLTADFTNVKEGGSRVRVAEGDYRAKVTGCEVGESKARNTMLIWEFTGTKGAFKGKKLKDYTTLTVESLWKLKKVFEALGINVPKKKLDLTPLIKEALGEECGVTLVDDEYEGKISSKIDDYIDLETLEASEDDDFESGSDDEDEDEKPKKKKKKKGKKKEEDDDEIEDLEVDDV